MMPSLCGFRQFFEDAGGPTTRPDQKSDPGKKYELDSFGTTAFELGIEPKDFTSQSFAGANYSLDHKGNNVMSGISSWRIVSIDDKTVTVELLDQGNKRLIKTGSGIYAKDPSKSDVPKRITMPREQFVKMYDQQLQSTGGAMPGGAPGGMPPMGGMGGI